VALEFPGLVCRSIAVNNCTVTVILEQVQQGGVVQITMVVTVEIRNSIVTQLGHNSRDTIQNWISVVPTSGPLRPCRRPTLMRERQASLSLIPGKCAQWSQFRIVALEFPSLACRSIAVNNCTVTVIPISLMAAVSGMLAWIIWLMVLAWAEPAAAWRRRCKVAGAMSRP